MKIKIISVGKIKEEFLRDGIAEYVKRLSRYVTLDLMMVSDVFSYQSSDIVFIIGGSLGLSNLILKKANLNYPFLN
jgi:23S rRNA pseudoU1915 N3-methylase RlmH